jgi:DHA1 family multidrug resistance protein-like MFS transporter
MDLEAEQRPAWRRTLYIIFFVQLITAVGFSSIFPFLPLFVKELGTNTSLSVELLSGLVFSAQAVTMMLASPIWGSLADRFGRKLMVQRASFGGALLLLLMAFARSAEELVALRAVQGLVTGVLAAANALVAAAVPRERTGYAMGMLQVALGSGLAIGPLIGGAVADAFGYSAAFYVTSVLLLIGGLTVRFGVQEEFEPLLSLTRSPLGFLSEWKEIIGGQGVALSYGIRFLTQLGRMMVIPIAPFFIAELLSDQSGLNTFTGLVIGLSSAAITASALYLGRIGDRIGHRRILIVSMILGGALYLPQSLVQTGWQLLVLQTLVGVAMGGIIPMVSALLAKYSAPGAEGAVYGLDNSIRASARSVAPLIGAGVALLGGLRATFAATGIIFLIGAALAAWKLPDPSLTEQ